MGPRHIFFPILTIITSQKCNDDQAEKVFYHLLNNFLIRYVNEYPTRHSMIAYKIFMEFLFEIPEKNCILGMLLTCRTAPSNIASFIQALFVGNTILL